MDGLERVFAKAGVLSNVDKDVVGERNATVVGIDLVEGTQLHPNIKKLWAFLKASVDLFSSPSCPPLELAAFIGTLQWFDLLNRWLLSCLGHVYDFSRAAEQTMVRDLPSDALSELMLNIALGPFWQADLRRGWHDEIVATDASPAYGFGVAVATCPRSTVRAIGRSSHQPGSHVRLRGSQMIQWRSHAQVYLSV